LRGNNKFQPKYKPIWLRNNLENANGEFIEKPIYQSQKYNLNNLKNKNNVNVINWSKDNDPNKKKKPKFTVTSKGIKDSDFQQNHSIPLKSYT